MLYAILCYNVETVLASWTREHDDAVMASHAAAQKKIAALGKLGPVARLMPTTTAVTIKPGRKPLVLDGPFAETRQQLLGFYLVDCASLAEVIQIAQNFTQPPGLLEIRPLRSFEQASRNQCGLAAGTLKSTSVFLE